MDNNIIDRGTNRAREWLPVSVWIAFKGRYCPMIPYEFLSDGIELPRRHAWLDVLSHLSQSQTYQLITLLEKSDFIVCFEVYHP